MNYHLGSILLLLLSTAEGFGEDKPAAVIQADICVYGGTSGGVIAAIQAKKLGKKVILVEPGRHLGGMTASGLSAVDIGDPRTIGGITREYFSRLIGTYGKKLDWDKPHLAKTGSGHGTGGAFSIEPHVAERLFEELIRESEVPVYRESRLASVKKENLRIRSFRDESGTEYQASMFIDATYEGDLMAKTGVSYTVDREPNSLYKENYNGIQYSSSYKPRLIHQKPGPNGRTTSGQGVWDRDLPLDPYVIPGDAKSGLLPLLNPGNPGKPGEASPGIQAYCYRLCLTTAENRLPIKPPADYNPKRYEIIARFIKACQEIGDDLDLRWFSKHDPLPNQKWDFNTATFGGNLPGANWEWPEATYARRLEIAKEHENYHRGLLHYLATDDSVPKKVRTEMKRFGLPRDEFPDTGGWPHQLYIREARRMVGDFVMTQHQLSSKHPAPNSIGIGSYSIDIHETRRIVKDGVVTREGKLGAATGGPGPYRIGYGTIVPKSKECENLLVTFAVSASHVAFASIRMEPVFMSVSQSAATAAALALDDGVSVQDVNQTTLSQQLLKDRQILNWPPPAKSDPSSQPKPE